MTQWIITLKRERERCLLCGGSISPWPYVYRNETPICVIAFSVDTTAIFTGIKRRPVVFDILASAIFSTGGFTGLWVARENNAACSGLRLSGIGWFHKTVTLLRVDKRDPPVLGMCALQFFCYEDYRFGRQLMCYVGASDWLVAWVMIKVWRRVHRRFKFFASCVKGIIVRWILSNCSNVNWCDWLGFCGAASETRRYPLSVTSNARMLWTSEIY